MAWLSRLLPLCQVFHRMSAKLNTLYDNSKVLSLSNFRCLPVGIQGGRRLPMFCSGQMVRFPMGGHSSLGDRPQLGTVYIPSSCRAVPFFNLNGRWCVSGSLLITCNYFISILSCITIKKHLIPYKTAVDTTIVIFPSFHTKVDNINSSNFIVKP